MILLCSLEGFGRKASYRPSVSDSVDRLLWDWQRKASNGDSRAIVVIGGSRALLGFDPAEFSARYPGYHVHQLSILGAHPLAILHELATDPEFRGIVLCEITEEAFSPKRRQLPPEYAGRGSWSRKLEVAIAPFVARLQQRLVLLNVQLSPRSVFQNAWEGSRFEYARRLPDRSQRCDSSLKILKASMDRVVRSSLEETSPASVEQWQQWVEASRDDFVRLRGRVIGVRFPVSTELGALYDRYFDQRRYWKLLPSLTQASAWLQSEDFAPTGLVLPDGLHLCEDSAAIFTRALAQELERRGLIHRPD